MIPTPILTVLSTFRKNGVQTLLMGGQACIFYGAAQVSKLGFGIFQFLDQFLEPALHWLDLDPTGRGRA